MKNLRYSLVFFIAIVSICVNLNAMEQEDNKDNLLFNCVDSDELVKVPVKIIKHSTALNHRFESQPSEPFYPLYISVPTFHTIVDCLHIIDAQIDVENKLLDYIVDFAANNTQQKMSDFYFAGAHMRIQPLCDSFAMYIDQMQQKISNRSVQKIDEIIQQAQTVFEKVTDKENSAIIFDVDDTALRCVNLNNKEISVDGIKIPYYPALEQVRDLYKQLVNLGFKIFFLTARVESMQTLHDIYNATRMNLKEEGYDVFEEVICVPRETREDYQKQANGSSRTLVNLLAQWKKSERNKIAEKFTIVGTLDDTEENLKGENVGYPVLIPRLC